MLGVWQAIEYEEIKIPDPETMHTVATQASNMMTHGCHMRTLTHVRSLHAALFDKTLQSSEGSMV